MTKLTCLLFPFPALLFEFLTPLTGPKAIQFANGAEGRRRHKIYSQAFNHESCVNLMPDFNKVRTHALEVFRSDRRLRRLHPVQKQNDFGPPLVVLGHDPDHLVGRFLLPPFIQGGLRRFATQRQKNRRVGDILGPPCIVPMGQLSRSRCSPDPEHGCP